MAITLFTGAGASKPLDYPTTTEFFSKTEVLPKQVLEVYQAIVRQFKPNVIDVEDALELVQPIQEFLKTTSGKFTSQFITNQWGLKISQFTQYTKERCFDLYGRIPEEKDVAKLYLPLFELCAWEKHRLSLFTANYDPVTDAIIDIAETKKIDCFDGFKSRGEWDPSLYKSSRIGLDIYRLHGSMSWIRQGNKIRNTRDYSRRANNFNDHLLIYPGYKGDPEAEGDEFFSFPHKALRQDLNSTSFFICVGFSFRDKHINKILVESFKKNDNLKMIIINPDFPPGINNSILKLTEKYSNRIFHISDYFGSESTLSELNSILKNGSTS